MAIAHMSYVICDVCGTPGGDVEIDAKTARLMLPRTWVRVIDPQLRSGRDLCPAHANVEIRSHR